MGKILFQLFAISAVVMVIFQNCGEDASFTTDTTSARSVQFNNNFTGDDEQDLGLVNEACDTLPRKAAIKAVRFPNLGQTCAWNENGNLGTRDRFFQARIEQKESLGLPVGAIICDAQFDFDPQPYRYDDYFALLFNDTVVTSGYNFQSRLSAGNFGILQYRWEDIRGMAMNFGSADEQVYCPQIPGAKARCQFPGHDTQGTISLDLDRRYVRAIMSNGVPADHSFTLVTFGDNDDRDCEHSDVEFDVSVTYVIKN